MSREDTIRDLMPKTVGKSRNNDLLTLLSAVRGEDISQVYPMYRDCFWSDDSSHIAGYDYLIYTAMGGNNYECWRFLYPECDDGKNGDPKKICPYHQLLKLEKDPRYLGGYNDDRDRKYRTLAFRFSDEERATLEKTKEAHADIR